MSRDLPALTADLRLDMCDLVGLYLFLHDRESELDERLEEFLSRAESELFRSLSIEEMEQLRHIYHEGCCSEHHRH